MNEQNWNKEPKIMDWLNNLEVNILEINRMTEALFECVLGLPSGLSFVDNGKGLKTRIADDCENTRLVLTKLLEVVDKLGCRGVERLNNEM